MCETRGCDNPVNRDGVCLKHKLKSVGFTGLLRLRSSREYNMTQREMRQEIFDEARASGEDIKQAGVTSPTSGPLMR